MPRPIPVTAAALIAWAFAVALITSAVVAVATFEQHAGLGTAAGPEATYMLAVVTVLSVAAILLVLGGLATWLCKTDMILVFTLWMVMVAAVWLAATTAEPPALARVAVYFLVTVAATAPVALLLLPDARAWLPPIPLHPIILVIVFGPLVGAALIVVRNRENNRFEEAAAAIAASSSS